MKNICTSDWRMLGDVWTEQLANQFDDNNYICEYGLAQVQALREDELERVKEAYTLKAVLLDEYWEALGYEDLKDVPGIDDDKDIGKVLMNGLTPSLNPEKPETVEQFGQESGKLPPPAVSQNPDQQPANPANAPATPSANTPNVGTKSIRSWPGGGWSVLSRTDVLSSGITPR